MPSARWAGRWTGARSQGLETVCAVGDPFGSFFSPCRIFFSVVTPKATEPNALIYLTFIGAVVLSAGLVTLGIGLLKKQKMAP